MKIKVGYLISYDYELFFTSVNQLYNFVDEIYLAIDINRKTWSGNEFTILPAFFKKVKEIDVDNKINCFEDDFYKPDLTPLENETRERNLLQKKMGNGWKLQLDVDEYIYDFQALVTFLKKNSILLYLPKLTPINFRGKWITLFKEVKGGFLYIENNEYFSFASNINSFTFTRNNKSVLTHFTNVIAIHQSWARKKEDILTKINNWGHKNDFDTLKYFEFWNSLNRTNYHQFRNFHPVVPEFWNELKFLPAKNINDFIITYSEKNPQQVNNLKPNFKYYLIRNTISTTKMAKFLKQLKIKKLLRKNYKRFKSKLKKWYR